MEFLIRPAAEADLPVLFSIMEQGLASVPKGWFAGETMEFLQTHLSGQGFILLAQTPNGAIAGYFAARFPKDAPDNLGLDVGLPEEELPFVAHGELAVVAPAFRGQGLQLRLLEALEGRLCRLGYRHLLCTIHPENRFSRRNMEAAGYRPILQKEKYGGLPRLILYKSNGPALAARQYPGLMEALLAFPGARTDYKPEWQWQRFLLQDKLFAALCTPGLQYKPHGGRTMLLLKCDPELAALYRLQYPQIVPGFYCDKRHWNSVYLDAGLDRAVLDTLIRHSYQLVFEKLPKYVQKAIQGPAQQE